jgi:hypothetical protein
VVIVLLLLCWWLWWLWSGRIGRKHSVDERAGLSGKDWNCNFARWEGSGSGSGTGWEIERDATTL